MRLFCKLSSSGSSDPYHFGGTRSVLSWETIVHCPRYKLRGQIRLKDTTLSLGSDLLLNHLFVLQVCFLYVFFLNELGTTVSIQLCCDAVIILCLDVSTSAREGFGCLVIIAYHELYFFLFTLKGFFDGLN